MFSDALGRTQREVFSATSDLHGALEIFVHSLRLNGSSCDDAIGEVGARARDIAPRDVLASDDVWEERWQRYYTLYDSLIRGTVRAYVLDQVAADQTAAPVRPSDQYAAAGSPIF
jgi:hypothetical protein